MTVTYSAAVATSTLGCFLRLLLRWRGSIYKLMWKEFVVFFSMYYFFGVMYHFVLSRHQMAKHVFEQIVTYCQTFSNFIPVAFILGFYINAINSRWWNQFCSIPWPDRTALYVSAYISEASDRARLMRRTIVRYINVSIAMTLMAVSPRVKKRFPTLSHLTEAGILLPNEEAILNDIQTPYNKYYIPLAWSMTLLTRCRKEGKIAEDFALKTILDEVCSIRSSLGMVFNYDWIPVPLVYTQVVTLAVHMFVVSIVFGQQTIESSENKTPVKEIYFPFFTFLQFFFYMGWLKVAEQMLNPFGEDDDDFDVNVLLDRHIKVAYLIVDEIHAEHPELIQDKYWDAVDFDLPYTRITQRQSIIPSCFNGSANRVIVKPEMAAFVPQLEAEPEGLDDDNTEREKQEGASVNQSIPSRRISQGPAKRASLPSAEEQASRTTPTESTSRRSLLRRLSRQTSIQDTRNSNDSNNRRLECMAELNFKVANRVPKAKTRPTGGSDCGQVQDFRIHQHRFQQHNEKALQIIRSSRCRRKVRLGLLDTTRVELPLSRSAKNRSGFVETNVTYV